VKTIVLLITLVLFCTATAAAQSTAEQRSPLNQPAVALDAKSAPALEATLLTQALNGSDDSPVMNIKVSIKNVTPNFYNYVSGWITFYDANAARCGDGQFKVDALAPQESAEIDTPGLRLRCSPASWRIVANNLLTRTADIAKPVEAQAQPVEPTVEKIAPTNYVISVDGREYPIQVNNPMVLRLGNRNRRIVLKPVP
jgi:hypothetical protein